MKQYLLLLPLLIFACSKVNQSFDPVDLGYDYFPLNLGIERIYQVDSIVFDSFNNRPEKSSSTHYIREVVVEDIGDSEGEVFRVERYYGQEQSGPWSIFDVVSEEKNRG